MSSTTVAEFAKELKKPTDTLIEQLKAAGVNKSSESDSLTEKDKQKLLTHLQTSHGTATTERKKISLVKKSTSAKKKPKTKKVLLPQRVITIGRLLTIALAQRILQKIGKATC